MFLNQSDNTWTIISSFSSIFDCRWDILTGFIHTSYEKMQSG